MNFITHHRFKELALCGEQLNIPYGMKLKDNSDGFITSNGKVVCCYTSENSKKHFAINDDGNGLERGALTYAIAYSNRNAGYGFRFSEEEAKILVQDWSHFLRKDLDVILFNDDFFVADLNELQKLADVLKIKVRRK